MGRGGRGMGEGGSGGRVEGRAGEARTGAAAHRGRRHAPHPSWVEGRKGVGLGSALGATGPATGPARGTAFVCGHWRAAPVAAGGRGAAYAARRGGLAARGAQPTGPSRWGAPSWAGLRPGAHGRRMAAATPHPGPTAASRRRRCTQPPTTPVHCPRPPRPWQPAGAGRWRRRPAWRGPGWRAAARGVSAESECRGKAWRRRGGGRPASARRARPRPPGKASARSRPCAQGVGLLGAAQGSGARPAWRTCRGAALAAALRLAGASPAARQARRQPDKTPAMQRALRTERGALGVCGPGQRGVPLPWAWGPAPARRPRRAPPPDPWVWPQSCRVPEPGSASKKVGAKRKEGTAMSRFPAGAGWWGRLWGRRGRRGRRRQPVTCDPHGACA